MEYSKKKCKKCFGGLIMVRVLKLRNIRIKEQKKLNENNFCLYKHIIAYIKATNLTIYEKEEILHFYPLGFNAQGEFCFSYNFLIEL